jgi:hypothetical protein
MKWNEAAERALTATDAMGPTRGRHLMAQERLAEDLTRERDGLYASLVARATERKLARDWATTFFRTTSSRAPEPAPAPTPTPDP